MISDIKGETQATSIWEENPEANTCAHKGWEWIVVIYRKFWMGIGLHTWRLVEHILNKKSWRVDRNGPLAWELTPHCKIYVYLEMSFDEMAQP